ncbi:Mitochondrial small ribosomal subunit Rsm22-domain-containing protein [Balamuthia mandrillaris]
MQPRRRCFLGGAIQLLRPTRSSACSHACLALRGQQLYSSSSFSHEKEKVALEDNTPTKDVEDPEIAAQRKARWAELAAKRKETKNLLPLKIGMVILPDQLKAKLTDFLRQHPSSNVTEAARQLAATLGQRTIIKPVAPESATTTTQQKDTPPPIAYRTKETLGYCAHRMPGVYACILRVLHELQLRRPEWRPRSLLDFGSGPGTAVWASMQTWPNISNVLAVEPSEAMTEAAHFLLQDYGQTRWQRILTTEPEERYDLVMAAFVLSELKDDAERAEKVTTLWRHTKRGGVLLFIEPGTPVGFNIIRTARSQVLEDPRHGVPSVLAPCPHNFSCPMKSDSWCHFSQRMQRLPSQLWSGSTAINWQDEKYSYVALTKGDPLLREEETFSRVLGQPKKRGGHVVLTACDRYSGMIQSHVLSKVHKEAYKEARKANWGDAFIFPKDSVRSLPSKTYPKSFAPTPRSKKDN